MNEILNGLLIVQILLGFCVESKYLFYYDYIFLFDYIFIDNYQLLDVRQGVILKGFSKFISNTQ